MNAPSTSTPASDEPAVSGSDRRLVRLAEMREELRILHFELGDGKCRKCWDTGRISHRSPGGFGISWPCDCQANKEVARESGE